MELKDGMEITLLEDVNVHIMANGRGIIVIPKGTRGIVDSSRESTSGKGMCYNIKWHLIGFDFITQYSSNWKIS